MLLRAFFLAPRRPAVIQDVMSTRLLDVPFNESEAYSQPAEMPRHACVAALSAPQTESRLNRAATAHHSHPPFDVRIYNAHLRFGAVPEGVLLVEREWRWDQSPQSHRGRPMLGTLFPLA